VKPRIVIFLIIAGGLLLTIMLMPATRGSRAQGNATSQRQTLNAIIGPRLTLTARSGQVQTATGAAAIVGTFNAYQTETSIALTYTATPTLTESPIDPTDAYQTLIGNVGERLTATAFVETRIAGTVNYENTINAIIIETLGITLTPTDTLIPIATNTPRPYTPNATERFQTAVQDAAERITRTVIAQATIQFEQTINAAINATLGISPTATETPIGPTPTFNPTEIQQTVAAIIDQSLTQTPLAEIAQTRTAAFQATVSEIVNRNQTATNVAVRATLVYGLEPLTAGNADRISQLLVLNGHTAGVQGVAFSPDGLRIGSAGLDNTIRLWNSQTGAEEKTVFGLTNRLAIAFSSDGTRIAATSADDTVRLYDARSGEEIGVLSGHTDDVLSVAFSPNGLYLVTGSADRTVRLWNGLTGASLATLKGHRGAVASVAFSPDGGRFVSGGQDSQVFIWETGTGVQIGVIRDVQRVSAIAFSPDGVLLATAGNGRFIQFWDANSFTRLAQFRGGINDVITCLAFSPDSTLIAAGSNDRAITLWNIGNAQLVGTLRGHEDKVTSVAFSPEGARLISGSFDRTVRLWGISLPPLSQ
jgi:WD40 repeat protein